MKISIGRIDYLLSKRDIFNRICAAVETAVFTVNANLFGRWNAVYQEIAEFNLIIGFSFMLHSVN